MAVRGARETDDGVARLEDEDLIAYFRRQAKKNYIRTFLATLMVLLLSRAWLHWYSPTP